MGPRASFLPTYLQDVKDEGLILVSIVYRQVIHKYVYVQLTYTSKMSINRNLITVVVLMYSFNSGAV